MVLNNTSREVSKIGLNSELMMIQEAEWGDNILYLANMSLWFQACVYAMK